MRARVRACARVSVRVSVRVRLCVLGLIQAVPFGTNSALPKQQLQLRSALGHESLDSMIHAAGARMSSRTRRGVKPGEGALV